MIKVLVESKICLKLGVAKVPEILYLDSVKQMQHCLEQEFN